MSPHVQIQPLALLSLSDQSSRTCHSTSYSLIFGQKDESKYIISRAIEISVSEINKTQNSSITQQQLYHEMYNLQLIEKPENPFDYMTNREEFEKYEEEMEKCELGVGQNKFESRDSNLVEFNNGRMKDGHVLLGVAVIFKNKDDKEKTELDNGSNCLRDIQRQFSSLLEISTNQKLASKSDQLLLVFSGSVTTKINENNLKCFALDNLDQSYNILPTVNPIENAVLSDLELKTSSCNSGDINLVLSHGNDSNIQQFKKYYLRQLNNRNDQNDENNETIENPTTTSISSDSDIFQKMVQDNLLMIENLSMTLDENQIQDTKKRAVTAALINLLSKNAEQQLIFHKNLISS